MIEKFNLMYNLQDKIMFKHQKWLLELEKKRLNLLQIDIINLKRFSIFRTLGQRNFKRKRAFVSLCR